MLGGATYVVIWLSVHARSQLSNHELEDTLQLLTFEIARDPVCATRGQRSSYLPHQQNLNSQDCWQGEPF